MKAIQKRQKFSSMVKEHAVMTALEDKRFGFHDSDELYCGLFDYDTT
jgi:hypothetical protein